MKLDTVRHADKNDILIISFIDIIYSYVDSIHKSSKENHKPLKGGLDMALRIVTGSHVSFVSEKVLDYLNENSIELNPFDLIWEERHKMGLVTINNRKYSMAVWEHTIPIKEFRESLLRKEDRDEIIEILLGYPGVAWISREEDMKLTHLGFQTKRPGGFLNCYDQAGIKLISEFDYKEKFN